MRKWLYSILIALGLVGCIGGSADDLRQLKPSIIKLTNKSKDDVKQCLLGKLDSFIPDRLVVNELSNRSEIFVGAIQAGKFRHSYLFTLKDKEISMFKGGNYFGPLTIEEAFDYIRICAE